METHQKYICMINSQRVMSTFATSEDAARAEFAEQLNRPGRYSIFTAWRDGGKVVEAEPLEDAEKAR